jgi:hypothetical protein
MHFTVPMYQRGQTYSVVVSSLCVGVVFIARLSARLILVGFVFADAFTSFSKYSSHPSRKNRRKSSMALGCTKSSCLSARNAQRWQCVHAPFAISPSVKVRQQGQPSLQLGRA